MYVGRYKLKERKRETETERKKNRAYVRERGGGEKVWG